MRGMGEKQLEIDKRLLRSRMAALRRSLDDTRRCSDIQHDFSMMGYFSSTALQLSLL